MAASQEQKVDFLLKKIGYVSSKTGIAEDSTLSGTVKAPFAEPIPSPLVVPSTSIWSDSSLIPATPPGSTSAIVQVYATASAKQLTVDSTVSGNRTFLARATPGNNSTAMEGNWIDPSFGADYVIKVFKGDPNSGGVQLSAAGSGSNDTWFFDYSSGVLNFNGTNVPSGVTATNIYLVGYRYLGGTGFNVSGPASFENLLVTGISTLGSSNGIGTVTIGIGGSALHVDGDARIIGKTFIGDGTITIDPDSNLININGSQIQRDSGGDLMIMTAGTSNYSKLRASDILIDTNTVIDNNRNYTGVAATFANMTITGDLTVEGTTTTLDTNLIGVDKLEIGANNSTVAAGITQSGSGNILNLYDSSSVVFSVEDGGRIVGTATSSVIPFLHPTLASLPNAGTYHGAFAHVHSEGKGYFAHGGNWFELVNKELNGTVGTGTETYDVGAATFSGLVKIGTTTEGHVNAENLTIADNGNCGITIRSGTTSSGFIYFSDATSGTGEYDGYVHYSHNTRALRFATAATERLRIKSNGNVGIATDNPSAKLDVMSTGNFTVDGDTFDGVSLMIRNDGGTQGNGNYGSAIGFTQIGNPGVAGYRAAITSVQTGSDSDQLGLAFLTHPSGVGGDDLSEALRIASSGYVGIATNSPASPLHIGQSTDNSVTAGITLKNNPSIGAQRFTLYNEEDVGTHYNSNDGGTGRNHIFESGGTEILRMTSTGKVKVPDNGKFIAGTSEDLQIFHNGTDSYISNTSGSFFIRTGVDNADIIIQSDDGSGGFAQYFRADGSSGQAIMYHYGSSKLNTVAAGINVTGNTETDDLTVTGTAYLNGTVSVGSSTGTNGQVLSSTGVGVTWTTLPTARTTSTQTASEDQTTFNFTYNVGFLDVFYNGVKLAPTEFTASNGSQVVLNDVAYAGDLVEFVSYGTVSTGGGGGGASNLNALADVTITGTPVIGETLTHNGSKFVNDLTTTTTTTATTQVSILSLDLSVYRSVEYQIQVTEGSKYHTTKILAIHNGTAAVHNEFGTLSIGTVPATFDVDISGSNLRLLATPASSNSTVFKVKFTAIKV